VLLFKATILFKIILFGEINILCVGSFFFAEQSRLLRKTLLGELKANYLEILR